MSFRLHGLTAERDPHDLRHQRAPPIRAPCTAILYG